MADHMGLTDAMMLSVTPRQELVLRLYYGLGCPKMSARDIGKRLGIGADGVHYIRKKAIKRMVDRMEATLKVLRDGQN